MFLTKRFYIILASLTLLAGFGYVFPQLFTGVKILLFIFAVMVVIDAVMLYHRRGISAKRSCSERFSNGDKNVVKISLESNYSFPVWLTIIDEAPEVFQRRDISYKSSLAAMGHTVLRYTLTPVKRGVYSLVRYVVSHVPA